ncbi:MAG: hypothetical protein WC426_03490 [Sulfuriferula sp.]
MVTSFGDRHAAVLSHWLFHHANGLRQLAFERLLKVQKLMLANIKISTDGLRDLTIKRVQGAKEYLLKTGAIEATRIFITTAKAETEEQKKLPDNRVDFILGSH